MSKCVTQHGSSGHLRISPRGRCLQSPSPPPVHYELRPSCTPFLREIWWHKHTHHWKSSHVKATDQNDLTDIWSCVDIKDHIDVCGLCCHQRPWWCLWSVIQPRAKGHVDIHGLLLPEVTQITMVHADITHHVDVHDPCCCWLLWAREFILQW